MRSCCNHPLLDDEACRAPADARQSGGLHGKGTGLLPPPRPSHLLCASGKAAAPHFQVESSGSLAGVWDARSMRLIGVSCLNLEVVGEARNHTRVANGLGHT